MTIRQTMSGFAVVINGNVVAEHIPNLDMAEEIESEYKTKPNGNGNGKKENGNKKKGMFSEYGFFSP